MFPFASPLRKSPELRRNFALVLASAEDQIVQANVEETVSFLKSTERQLPFENALSIFFRLIGLPTRLRHAVTIHSLSRLGETEEVEELVDDAPVEEPGAVRALARRLRGRRREELRHDIETAALHARARLRGAYVEGANRSVDSLRDVVSPKEAVQYFVAALEIGPEWAELIAHEVVGVEWAGLPEEPPVSATAQEEQTSDPIAEALPHPELKQLPIMPESSQDQPPAPEA